ncbi:MAG: chromate transporter [Anaerovoracaceae bacterium]|jgi:chromate transporter
MIALFLMFMRIGAFSFGGGMAMLPLIFQSVQDFGFMSSREFSDLVALSQVTPGPIAVNAATYVGMKFGGVAAAAVATLGVALPSFVIMLIAMKFLDRYYDSLGVQGALTGLRPAVVGLIAAASVFVAKTTFTFELKKDNIIMLVITLCVVALTVKNKVNPIWLIIIAGVAGAFIL